MGQESIPTTSTPPATTASAEAREARLKVYDRMLATVSALGLLMGGVWAVYTYSQARHKEVEQKAAEAKQAAELREKEIQLRKQELDLQVFKERKETYYALCDAACEIVACRNRKEVEERSQAFLKMYYGRAHIIAEGDPDVSAKKIAFKKKLMEYLEGESKDSMESPFTFFGTVAFDLTKTCQKHMDPRTLGAATP
jgi:hypothetical protein